MTESRDQQAYEVVWLIRRLFRTMAQLADGYLEDSGLSAADRAVMKFLYPDEKLSVPEIAARYDVSRQHVQVTVNGLLAKGLALSEANPRHKRSPLIALDEAGRETFAEIRKNESRLVALLFSNTRDDDLETTRRTLASIHEKLSLEK
jgi:DNA-binding MarR family transcriptional regulator